MSSQLAHVEVESVPMVPLGSVVDVLTGLRSSDMRQVGSLFEATVETEDVDELGDQLSRALEHVLATHPRSLILERTGETRFVVRPAAG